jgi:hypothetical protein
MHATRTVRIALTGLVFLIGAVASSAYGASVDCTGTLSGAINSDVNIPAGADCALNNATVTGSVTGTGLASFFLGNSSVGGGVTLLNGTGDSLLEIFQSTVGGSVLFQNNNPENQIDVQGSTINGNLTFDHNCVDSFMGVFGSLIKGSLVFTGNCFTFPQDQTIPLIFVQGNVQVLGALFVSGNSNPAVIDETTRVPEPASALLVALGVGLSTLRLRRRRSGSY